MSTGLITVAVASVAFAVGGAFMKASNGFTRFWPSSAVLVLFVLGSVLLARAVRLEGLSTAYLLGLGLEALASVGLGLWLYGERLSPGRMAGVVLIAAGVAVVRIA
jgi:multidrug transporter EmrE-like cation transporter